jgi:hypothetical protein
MGRSVVAVVMMATVGAVAVLVAGMAFANPPPPDPGPGGPGSGEQEYLALAYSSSLHNDADRVFYFIAESLKLGQAKEDAYQSCTERAEGDCRGIAWVTDGYISFAVEDIRGYNRLDDIPQDYNPSWGWAIGKTRDSVNSNALKQCYLGDPVYSDCKRVLTTYTNGANSPPNNLDGGSWFNP